MTDRSPRCPRVVFVNRFYRPDISATSQMLTDLAERLAASGVDIHVLCSQQRYDDPTAQLPRSEHLAGVQVRRVATSRFGRDRLIGRAVDYLSFYLKASWVLVTLLRRGDVLVVKTDPPLMSIPAALIATLRGARLVNWLQDVFPEVATQLGVGALPRWLDRPLRALRDRSLRSAAFNVVLGQRMRGHVESLGAQAARIRIVENWSQGGEIRPTPALTALRQRLALGNVRVVGYSGNLGRAHEFDTLLSAAMQMADDPTVIFLMIGGGAGMNALRAEVQQRGLGNFRFLPYQPSETLADSLAAIDVHLVSLLPSLEGLIVPSKIYGILAAGRPTVFIGDSKGEVAQLLAQFDCGAVVGCGDGAGLSRELRAMLEDDVGRMQMGRRARIAFEARGTLARAERQWLDLLRELGLAAGETAPLSPARTATVAAPPR